MARLLLVQLLTVIASYCQLLKAQESGAYELELIKQSKNYADAVDYCDSRNSWLAEIKTNALQSVLKSLLCYRCYAWIGGKYYSTDDAWKWGDGTHVMYDGWENGYSNQGSGNCIDANPAGWGRHTCGGTRWFVCQRMKEWVVIFGSKQLQFFHEESKSFTDAQAACRSWDTNGHLVHIKTNELDQRITNELTWRKATGNFYSSGNDKSTEGRWKWGDQTLFSLNVSKWRSSWFSSEPDGGETENCMAKSESSDWEWIDIGCSRWIHYICEKYLLNFRCSNADFCSNRGACIANNNKTSCYCNKNYQGRMCEIDHCEPNPCLNGGACYRTASSPYYVCNCTSAYKGSTCSTPRYQRNEKSGCQYRIFSVKKRAQTQASTICNTGGGSLAILSNELARAFALSQVSKMFDASSKLRFWVGGERKSGGVVEWADGTNLRPFWYEYGNCLEARISGSPRIMTWYTSSCQDALGFICEKPISGNGCDGIVCSRRGTCENLGCHYRCDCDEGYDGRHCERDLLTVSIKNSTITVKEGEEISILLTVLSYVGTVQVDWYRNTNKATIGDQVGNGTQAFPIGSFTQNCKGTSCYFLVYPYGGKTFLRKAELTVIVIKPAKITSVSAESIIVPPYSNPYSVTCYAKGEPSPTVLWYKGSRIVPEYSNTIRINGGVYQTKGTKQSYLSGDYATKSYAGKYTCRANNTIFGSPKEDNKNVYLRVRLRSVSNIGRTEELFTKRAEFSCSFQAFPKPTITWRFERSAQSFNISTKNGSIFEISNDTIVDGVVSTETSNLTINPADFLGTVTVSCVASNMFESDSNSFTVNERIMISSTDSHYIYSKQRMARNAAEIACTNMNGSLAKIPDKKTQILLAKGASSFNSVSICVGGIATIEEDFKLWKWPDGSMFYNQSKHGSWNSADERIIDGFYIGWYHNRPFKNEDNCLCLGRNNLRMWWDANCNNDYMFICEKSIRGKPVIESLRAEDCSPVIEVSWRPSEVAIGIAHRIQLQPVPFNSDSAPEPVDIVPKNQIEKQTFRNLSYSTIYTVRIYVCPEYCLETYYSFQNATTGPGFPGEVRNAIVSQSDDGKCIVSWSEPESADGLTLYDITAESELVYYSFESMKNVTFMQENKTLPQSLQYTHHTFPNMNYTFRVRAVSCAGSGSSVSAQGTCITKRAAPFIISALKLPPEIAEDGTIDVTLPEISENNGPISCVFVIVVRDAVSLNEKEFGDDKLRSISVGQLQKTGSEYIAMALAKSEISNRMNADGEIALTIGDNSTTSCNVINVTSRGRSKRDTEGSSEYSGQNENLDKSKTYGFVVVSSTPGEDGIMYKSSEMVTIGDVDGAQSSSLAWIAAVVGGILLVAILVVLVLLFVRRQKHVAPLSPNESRPIPMATVSNASEPVYANLTGEANDLRSDTDILMERLESVYNSLRANRNKGFGDEYQRLKTGVNSSDLSTAVASRDSLKKKNRYKNILPYDRTRVKLCGEGDESYINASYIQGFNQEKKFIATQGPLPSTVNDFWRMIAEQRCRVIVMLTKCYENGKKKCERYWPELGQSIKYGSVTVQNLAASEVGGFIERSLRITSNSTTDEIRQFQFLKWPDHDVPTTTSSFFRLHQAVFRRQRELGTDTAMVVHCSAGAGRTGTFIAYDYLTEEKQNLDRVDVYQCVLGMRKQRVQMVQNCDQYILVNKLILEEYIFGITELESNIVASLLSERDIEARLSEEFSNLTVIEPIHTRRYGEHQDLMNRKKNNVPYYQTRVVMAKMGEEIDDPYINASHVEAYDEAYSLIAAQGPTESSLELFWRAAFDNHVSLIIMLTKCKEVNRDQCTQYWPAEVGDTMKVKNISVEMKVQYIDGKTVVRELHVTKQGETKKIMQYQCKEWQASSSPANPDVVLDLVSKMQQEIHQHNSPTVLVHCSDGVGRTGTFCAILNLIERLNCENVVDVFREVKDLRDCRPGMVQTLKQYRFCYEAVSAYLEKSSTYSNFGGTNEEKVYENL